MYRFFIFLIVISALSCKNSTTSKPQAQPEPKTTPPLDIKLPANGSALPLEDLFKYVGRKPDEFGFFENFGLTPRIQNVLKDGYSDFLLDFKNPSVLKRDGDLLYISGCQELNCHDNLYFIVIDVATNDINIHNFKGHRGLSYEEKTVIAIPTTMSEDLDKLRKFK